MEALMSKITDKEFSQYFQAVSFQTTDTVRVESIICSHSNIFIGGNIQFRDMYVISILTQRTVL